MTGPLSVVDTRRHLTGLTGCDTRDGQPGTQYAQIYLQNHSFLALLWNRVKHTNENARVKLSWWRTNFKKLKIKMSSWALYCQGLRVYHHGPGVSCLRPWPRSTRLTAYSKYTKHMTIV